MADRINRRRFLAGAAGALSAAALGCRTLLPGRRMARRPNILFLFPDQLRTAGVGCYGGTNVPTPNIDRLGSQGVRFTNALSTCPLCTPYRGMLMTGRYATHTGAVCNFTNLNPREYGIAEAMSDAGYRTGYIGKWHLNSGRLTTAGKHPAPKAQGPVASRASGGAERTPGSRGPGSAPAAPEPEYTPPGPARQGFDFWAAYNFHGSFNHAFYYRDTPERLFMPRHETDSETDMAIEYMGEHADDPNPFFLMVSPHPPHPPWNANSCPKEYFERVKTDLDWLPNVANPPEEEIPPRAYYAMIAHFDENVGRLMQFLDESGLADNTIFVLTSDHGEMLHSHGRTNKMVPYAEAVDVPLIVRWPGHTRARRLCDALYTPMDHMPTLLSLAGAAIPGEIDGRNLGHAILGKTGPERDAALIANYVSNWDYFETGTQWPEWRGVRTKRHTYVKWLNGKEELYDNDADPFQMDNLAAAKNGGLLEGMRTRLKPLLTEAHDDFLPGTAYADWYDEGRNVIRTGLGAA